MFANRTLIETGAQQAVWEKRIKPDYHSYKGLFFEKVCMDYLNAKNAGGELPIFPFCPKVDVMVMNNVLH